MAHMTADDLRDFDTVLAAVSRWPSRLRLSLAQALLKTLESEVRGPRRKISGAEAQGILAGSGPAPSDAEVSQMVDDYLTEKYGQ